LRVRDFSIKSSIIAAAVIGDSLNYSFGKFIGPKIFKYDGGFFFKKQHPEHTRRFYEKHGPKTIVLGRFIPIIRTFAPFVAGVGSMHYARFPTYNAEGGIVWIFIFVLGGFLFGNIPIVKNNFELVILIIIFASVVPVICHLFKHRSKNKITTRPLAEVDGEGGN